MPIEPLPPQQPVVVGKRLKAVTGLGAAALLLYLVPLMESNRHVQIQVDKANELIITHQDPYKYSRAYLDITGVPTACDGLTGPTIRKGSVVAPSQCQAMLEAALQTAAVAVEKCSPIDGTAHPYQLTAYVDFAYNLGGGAWCKSHASRAVKAGMLAASCDLLLPYDKARVHGRLVPVADLTRRRHREMEYCETGLIPDATPANLPARLRGL